MKIFKLIPTKLAIICLIALALFLSKQQYGQYRSKKAIEEEKNKIAFQINQLSQKNEELKKSLEYLNSENFKAQVAREQLNLKKEGEKVFSFGKKENSTVIIPAQKEKSNPEKWLEYFFK